MSQRKRGVERRLSSGDHEFPLTLASGEVIPEDRRRDGDRRALGPVAE